MIEYHYLLPSRSVKALNAQPQHDAQNTGLLFDRFVPDITKTLAIARQHYQDARRQDPRARLAEPKEGEIKRQWLEMLVLAATRADKEILARQWERWNAQARFYDARIQPLATDWRLVTGLGHKGPLEIGFVFNRYGFPYLPASGVKGLARASAVHALSQVMPGVDPNDVVRLITAETDSEFNTLLADVPSEAHSTAEATRRIFGSPAAAGSVRFFDACPDGDRLPVLEIDVMTPHYPRYYQQSDPPTDDQDPVPIPFLTVARGTIFWFAVANRPGAQPDYPKDAEYALNWLMDGLVELGAGGKTAAGYGHFQHPDKAVRAKRRPQFAATPGYWENRQSELGTKPMWKKRPGNG